MKNRKTIIVGFILVACMLVGVGYAALSTTLTINGTAGVSPAAVEFTKDVKFISAESNNTAFGTASPGDGQAATFTVSGMTQINDRVQFTYTIANYSDHEVNIAITTTPTTSDTSGLFAVTTALSNTTIPAATNETTPGIITATVTVVLNQTKTEAVDAISYVIEYTATTTD